MLQRSFLAGAALACALALSACGNARPVATSEGSAAQCGSCHGNPNATPSALPTSGHAPLAAGSTNATCNVCHPATVDASGNLIPGGKHMSGEVDPVAKHPAGWLDTSSADFHGLTAALGIQVCDRCHSARGAAKVTTIVCASCHDGLADGNDWTVTCNTCHGSAQNAAPPRDALGYAGTGAHQKHVAELAKRLGGAGANATCAFCHAVPANVYDAGHLDGQVSVTGYTGANAVWKTAVKDPAWSAGPATCATSYCHGAFRNGNAANAPIWTGQNQAACGSCHGLPPPSPHPSVGSDLTVCAGCHADTVAVDGTLKDVAAGGKHLDGLIEATGHDASWMDQSSTGFHAYAADQGLAPCQACHGQDLGGGAAGVACAQCHDTSLPPGVTSWKTNCTMCHGGNDNATGAPPRTTWGQNSPADTTNVRIGAHTIHVTGSAIAPPFDCSVCHVKPADALASGHIDGATATVTFGGIGAKATGSAWDRTSATCSNVYCHGAFTNGAQAAPVWTKVGQGQADCGTCHGLPPGGSHPAVGSDLTVCAGCHTQTMTAQGTLIPPSQGGKHLDGVVEGGGHDASWMDASSTGFHAYSANQGLQACTPCHGPTLDGIGSVPACGSCHNFGLPAGVTSWKTNCVMCHGGNANQTGAPPRATWGQNTPADNMNVRIGAHTVHVTGSNMAPPFGCEVCHVKPADALAAGHIDGSTATVTFGGLAVQGTTTAPAWNRTTATCSSTYCHGSAAPVWTGGSSQAACGSCHGLPPPAPHPTVSTALTGCVTCHSSTVDATGALIPPPNGKHLDGIIEGGHDASWMDTSSPGFHAYSANQGLAMCTVCHGPTLDGTGTVPGCGYCHDQTLPPGITTWKQNCTMCHGDPTKVANGQLLPGAGAPPRPTWPNSTPVPTTDIRVGAHSSHVFAAHGISQPLDCSLCHVKPADALAAGHVDAVVTVTGYAGSDPSLAAFSANPGFNASTATCSTSYCHGGEAPPPNGAGVLSDGNHTSPIWTQVDGTQAACGTCHGIPPYSGWGHGYPFTHNNNACTFCHYDVADDRGTTITNPSLHVNGVVDVRDRNTDPNCVVCHGQ